MSSDNAKPNERRQQLRYAVSDDCRLRASILLRSSDPATASKEWSGTLVNVSAAVKGRASTSVAATRSTRSGATTATAAEARRGARRAATPAAPPTDQVV